VGEAETLEHLGDACRAAGDPQAARSAWAQTLALLDGFSDGRLDKLHTKLASLPS
jgi:hypothetical protein